MVCPLPLGGVGGGGGGGFEVILSQDTSHYFHYVTIASSLTSMPEKVGRSWSKKGSKIEPCVPKRECITSATFLRYCSSVSSYNNYVCEHVTLSPCHIVSTVFMLVVTILTLQTVHLSQSQRPLLNNDKDILLQMELLNKIWSIGKVGNVGNMSKGSKN